MLAVVLLSSCSTDVAPDDNLPLPEGTGRVRLTICTPEENPAPTRAVNTVPWEVPDHEWERMQTFRILICNSSNKVVQIIEGDKNSMTAVTGSSHPYKQSAEIVSAPLPAGSYYIYATANYADGYTVGSTFNPNRTERFANGYSEANIPMTGKLPSAVNIVDGAVTDAGIITVWRVIGKLQFELTNAAPQKIKIKGIEVEPITSSTGGSGIYLFSKDDLTSVNNLAAGGTTSSVEGITLPSGNETETVKHETELTLNASNGTGSLFFYVNETDASYTVTQNQYSVRFKIQRQKPDESWYDEEIRYGFTTHHDLSGSGPYGGYNGGFNVIRRNDWIHIPIVLTDWQLRIEPLAFVPIAGYPATLLSSDALTATFSTGGMIALQPFVRKSTDATWRDFEDPEIDLVSVNWKNADGNDVSGTEKIIKTPFIYDSVTKSIIGELNNNLPASYTDASYTTTIDVHVKLGPSGSQYDYTFTFNVILKE